MFLDVVRSTTMETLKQLFYRLTIFNIELEQVFLALASRAQKLIAIRCSDLSLAIYSTSWTTCTFLRRRRWSSSSAFVSRGRLQAMSCYCTILSRMSRLTKELKLQFSMSRSSDDDATDSCYWHFAFGDCCWSVETTSVMPDDRSC